MRSFLENSASLLQREMFWQIHQSAELFTSAASACEDLSSHCVSITSRSIVTILLYSRLNVLVDNLESNFIVFQERHERKLLIRRHHYVQIVAIFARFFPEVELWTIPVLF
jgi:hypothetical protein